MKKRVKLFILLFLIFIDVVHATTIKETLINGDGYDTILPNTFIIGVTKFSGDEVITASKAATAGANDAMIYALKNGTTKGYQPPVIYYYVDANVGWFQFDSNNIATPVTDRETLEKLSSIDIYYVNNVEKKINVSYGGSDIDTNSLEDGITFQDGAFLVNATVSEFTASTTNGKEIKFIKDEKTSKYIEDTSSCYQFENGIIIDYNPSCGTDVTIPTMINGANVTGIAENAFNGKNLTSVVIPNSIVTIGNNAFFNNDELEEIIIDDKYDGTDFTSLNENAFPSNVNISYRNELTNALKSLPKEYNIKIDSSIDTNTVDMTPVITNEIFKEINTDKYSFHIDQSEIDKYYMIHYYTDSMLQSGLGSECTDHIGSSFDMFFTVEDNSSFIIYFQKRTNQCTRTITVQKKITINYETSNNLIDKLSVDNSISNLKTIDSEYINKGIVTNRKNLEDFVDENKLDYLFNSINGRIVEPQEDDEIGGSITTGKLYLFKNDILYKIVDDLSVVNLSNIYYPEIDLDDDMSSEEIKNVLVSSFETKTNITNYTILTPQQNKELIEKIAGAKKVYYMALFNKDTLEYWSIYLKVATEDKYNSLGFTDENCFTISDNNITKYDGTCGANVKIPDKIANQYVYYIADDVFYNYELESIQLPSKLVNIGNNAFYKNNIKELVIPDLLKVIDNNAFNDNKISSLIIPYNVTRIGENAFSNNKISSLKMTDFKGEMGQSAFTNNKLEEKDAFIYEREYDYNSNQYIVNNTKLNSYAGANTDDVVIPNQITEIEGNAFKGVGIKKVTLPYGIKRIGYYAFSENNLTSISIPDTIEMVEWGAFIYNKFKDDNSFIYCSDNHGNINKSELISYAYNVPIGESYLRLDKLEIPASVKKIWHSAFSSGQGLYVDDLIIPYGVEEIGNEAFTNVIVKNKLSLPKSVYKIGINVFSFENNQNPYVYARNEDGTEDTSILMAYTSYGYQQTLTLPSNIKVIRENVFTGKSFSAIELEDGVEEIGDNAFSYMYYLNKVVTPSTLIKIGDNAFAGNNSLTKLVLNDGVEEIGENAFFGHRLTEITIPSSVKKIGNNAFYKDYYSSDADKIQSITLNNGIEEIGENAFATLSSLNSISIPSSVRIIGNNAFGYVENVIIYGKSSFDDFENDVYLKNYTDISIQFISEN